jgi:hypothetical protein
LAVDGRSRDGACPYTISSYLDLQNEAPNNPRRWGYLTQTLTKASVSLRSAKLRLLEAEELIALAGSDNVKADVDKALSYVGKVLQEIDRKVARSA